ncbi:gamma-glutamyltransferase family protein [Pseudomonas sp. NW5]|uniref:gamma-glutamyltransferase family protein n=1 Tax=Pseudomonas sp. NW5 TaxID=2934934 RepID=UPI0020219EB7|nr:gamma-glutamyltransferase family protein [Pseudomonas sp. NW5]MCL7462123.1 gamma-glutamyltransferase family protein [Pseudomonas sp. NW5]
MLFTSPLARPAARHISRALLAASLLLSACSTPPSPTLELRPLQPESASGYQPKPGWTFERQAVAAANPLAAAAGLEMLRAGGNALDAAIAVQLVLGVVEPQSSGIGGGAFLLHWDGQRLDAWDGRETAPQAADERLFLDEQGQPLPFMQALVGGRAVGTPGLLKMLEQAHRAHGRLPWSALFVPAIELAEQGFAVSPRLHALLAADNHLPQDPAAARLFYPEGQPLATGARLRNPALAEILRRVAAQGSAAFYQGQVADALVARVQGHAGNPGRLGSQDLARYQPLRREALCQLWLSRYRVCGFPPPSSGHLTLMQILGLLAELPALEQPLVQHRPSDEFLHRYSEASRLAFADRAQYIADPAFVRPPARDWRSLLAADYLRQRAALIGATARTEVTHGLPGGQPLAQVPQAEQPEFGTSHISIIDRDGRAVAMTSSIEAAFGARLLSDGGTGLPGGFLLNNQLTDFAFVPRDARGYGVANRVEPGKRPRSSMSPALVFEANSGTLLASLGSPGGAGIIHFTAKTLLGLQDWQLSPQRAIDLPNFINTSGALVLERGRFPEATLEALRGRGHTVSEEDLPSGIQALQRRAGKLQGGADPRREGVVVGD